MAPFRKKQLTPSKRICLRLKEAREASGMSLIELARKTKINKRYLEALEACEFDELPKALLYQRKFIKAYVEALGLAAEPFVHQFMDEETTDGDDVVAPTRTIGAYRFHNIPMILRICLISALALSLMGYLGWQVKQILEPPKLVIYSPQSGLVTQNSTLLIIGETDPEVSISINGEQVLQNEGGQFRTSIDLALGMNTITVRAEKKHGKTTTETRYVILKESA